MLKVRAITTQRGGRRGRPRKVISEAFLKEAFKPGRNISISKLAELLTSWVSAKHTRRVGVKVWVVGLCSSGGVWDGYSGVNSDRED